MSTSSSFGFSRSGISTGNHSDVSRPTSVPASQHPAPRLPPKDQAFFLGEGWTSEPPVLHLFIVYSLTKVKESPQSFVTELQSSKKHRSGDQHLLSVHLHPIGVLFWPQPRPRTSRLADVPVGSRSSSGPPKTTTFHLSMTSTPNPVYDSHLSISMEDFFIFQSESSIEIAHSFRVSESIYISSFALAVTGGQMLVILFSELVLEVQGSCLSYLHQIQGKLQGQITFLPQMKSKLLVRRNQANQRHKQVIVWLTRWNSRNIDSFAQPGRILQLAETFADHKVDILSIQEIRFPSIHVKRFTIVAFLIHDSLSWEKHSSLSRILRQTQKVESEVIDVLTQSITFSVVLLYINRFSPTELIRRACEIAFRKWLTDI